MGAGASSKAAEDLTKASEKEVADAVAALTPEERKKLSDALNASDSKAKPAVKVFGMPVSQGCVGPILVAMEAGVGGMEMCNLMEGEHMKPEFIAMNPFHHVPTLKDGDTVLGESNAILRYLAIKYKPELYPTGEPETCALIDYALESMSNDVYEEHKKTVYVGMGFGAAPEDQEAANKKYNEVCDTWAGHFLKGKFVCGDKLSIADYKAAPFFCAAVQPAMESKIKLKMSDRIRQYVDDFSEAVKSSELMKSAGGYSITEFIASKDPDAKASSEYKKAEYADAAGAVGKAAGEAKIFGMPVSQTCMGPILCAMDAGKGAMEMCNLMEGAHMKPEFLAMNPFHHVPTMKDGDLAVGESNGILRFLAMKYKPEYYPVSDPDTCARIDWAMDTFNCEVYFHGHRHTVYPVMGFAPMPEDKEAAVKKYNEVLDTWSTLFLKGKFVCGDKLSIADFKAVPFLLAAAQPAVEKKIGLKVPERITKYIEDFCAAVPSSEMLKSAGGYSIVEYLKTKEE